MKYIVSKDATGGRKYGAVALENACRRGGATEVIFAPGKITVTWPEQKIDYAVAEDGRVHVDLAWDMQPAQKEAPAP
jgi:hypothetical protein